MSQQSHRINQHSEHNTTFDMQGLPTPSLPSAGFTLNHPSDYIDNGNRTSGTNRMNSMSMNSNS